MNHSREEKPIAIVIGGNQISRLNMVRAAGLSGCDVIVFQTEQKKPKLGTIDDKSKYVIDCKYFPNIYNKRLLDTLRGYQGKGIKIIILPTDDSAAVLIDTNLNNLKDEFFVPNVNKEQGAVLRLMDKSLQKKIAIETGMNVSKEWICKWSGGGYLINKEIEYPCFTKPQLSTQGDLKKYQRKCDNQEELEKVLSEIAQFYQSPILVEEYHHIDKEYAIVGLSLKDNCITPAVIQMEYGWQGVTASGKVFPISRIPNLEESLKGFMARTHLIGLFDIDLYESNGKLYFNELNVRCGATGFAVNNNVINLPEIYIRQQFGLGDSRIEIPKVFEEFTFVNENCLSKLYFDHKISYKEYKSLYKGADKNAIYFEEDLKPYRKYKRTEKILPLWKFLKKTKKVLFS